MTTPAPAGELRAGVIGLGMIGGGVAVSLARAGRPLTVYDLRADAAEGLVGVPSPVANPAEVAQQSDVVLIAVVDANQAHEVLTGPNGVIAGGRQGLTVVLLSTVSVPEVHQLARLCAASGVSLLDCGVTPGDRAADGQMVAMVGGDDDIVAGALPVLTDFTRRVVHCGPSGAGMATKIARNVITYGSWRAAFEAAELAESAGVTPATLMDVVAAADRDGTTLFAWLRHRVEPLPRHEEFAAQTLRLMDKDLAAAQDLADHNDVAVPLVDVVRARGEQTLGVVAPVGRAEDKRAVGLQTMAAVYGTAVVRSMPEELSPTTADTIDHLFGEIWSRPGLSIRDRRLLVLGATAALGRADLIEVQARGALLNDELSAEELQEAVLQLHYYVGWGNGTRVQQGVDTALDAIQGAPPETKRS